jgi:hypothetical protein
VLTNLSSPRDLRGVAAGQQPRQVIKCQARRIRVACADSLRGLTCCFWVPSVGFELFSPVAGYLGR